MTNDDIMKELHQIKDELSAECNYDVKVLFERLQQIEKTSGRNYVSFDKKDAAGKVLKPVSR